MECFGPECASSILRWLQERAGARQAEDGPPTQGVLFGETPYRDEAPTINTSGAAAEALDHLEYAAFRRFHNQVTRAERARLENTIENAVFKLRRFFDRDKAGRSEHGARFAEVCEQLRQARERARRALELGRRADARLAQLGSLSPEQFEEFVAELFEALGYQVEHAGGTGDEGADLIVTRGGLRCIVQCKYHRRGVIGSPDLQRFLGSVHHFRAAKGFFVTTRTFSLGAERFASEHPIELIEGARLEELVREALGPGKKKDDASWFSETSANELGHQGVNTT